MKQLVTILAVGAVLAPAAMGAQRQHPPGMAMGSAPADLVVNGAYSDKRFIDMMVPHHLMAIAMARLELRLGSRQPLKQVARNVISSQQREVKELTALRARLYGSAAAPTGMSIHQMDNLGMMDPSAMSKEQPFDKAFIDGMIPHHAGAIDMANVVLMRSKNPALRRIARAVVDAQAQEIGKMIGWRLAWYRSS